MIRCVLSVYFQYSAALSEVATTLILEIKLNREMLDTDFQSTSTQEAFVRVVTK